MKKIRILIADDHALMRVGLCSMLGLEPDMEIVGEAANGRDAVQQALQLRPDVVIMDLMMPKLGGADATHEILRKLPGTRIVILTSFGTSAEMQRAIANGATGVQLKEDPTEDLIRTIREVVQGRTVLPTAIQRTDAPLPESLTDKQADLLRLVLEGLTDRQIALRLNISESGVKKHLKLIFSKLNATNRTEAVAIALRKQLLKI